MKPLQILFVITTLLCFGRAVAEKKIPLYKALLPAEDSISYKITGDAANGYGYNIYYRQQLYIHQPSVPCLQGRKGFCLANDARKVALLVIDKIKKGKLPPSISLQELKQLQVLH